MIETNKDIKNGWCIGSVCDVANLLHGISYAKEQSSKVPSTGMVPILRATNISSGLQFDDLVYVERQLVSDEQFIRKNDIIFAMSSGSKKHVGKSAIANTDFHGSFGAFCGLLRVSPSFEVRYLAYYFKSSDFRRHIEEISKGTNINNLKREHILDFEFSVPPLNEQKRIVAKIEELFSELDKGIENLKTAREQLKVYRHAVLKHAFEGKLTAHWREQNKDKLESADQLLERIKQEREAYYQRRLKEYTAAVKAWEVSGKEGKKPKKPKELEIEPTTNSSIAENLPILPVGWNWVPLSCFLSLHKKPMTTGPFGTMLNKNEHTDSGVPVLGIENIGQGKFVAGNKIFVTEQKAYELVSFEVEPADVLISRSGTVGEICEVPSGIGKALISTNLLRVSFNSRLIISQFFVLLFQGAVAVKKQVKELCKGSSRDFLNQSILSSIVFPLPCIAEQGAVLEQIASRLSLVDNLEQEIDDSLEKSEALRQSILKKAFSGKLVAQDPNDEPASALLERIRAEKEAQKTESKKLKAKKEAA